MSLNFNPVSLVLEPLMEIFKARQELKANKELAQAKVKQASIEGQTQLEMTAAEWEALAVAQTANTWKDEYVTIVVTAPLILLLIGGIYGTLTGDTSLLAGVTAGIVAIESTGVDMGLLMNTVVFAAIGLKFWRK